MSNEWMFAQIITIGLASCPFCKMGSTQVIRALPEGFCVICKGCEARGPLHILPSLAAEEWNARDDGTSRLIHYGRKLTKEEVKAIRAKLADTTRYRTHQSLAGEYGVSRSAITKIANGENWKGVE